LYILERLGLATLQAGSIWPQARREFIN
jgi:hypothetical protein